MTSLVVTAMFAATRNGEGVVTPEPNLTVRTGGVVSGESRIHDTLATLAFA